MDSNGTFRGRQTSGFGNMPVDATLDRDELDGHPDHSVNYHGNKENDNLSQNSGSKLHNRYKRSNRNDASLNNYKEKYNKLEENFKRFTASLQDKRSTSNNLRAQNVQNNIMNQSIAPSTLGPIRSDVSPVRHGYNTVN
jgi:hypothetical protein